MQLCKEFLITARKPRVGTAKWRGKAVQDYLQKANAFLKRLLLIIHLIGGQWTLSRAQRPLVDLAG
jgi:hypothetical protein